MIAGRNNIIQAFNGAMNFSHNVSYVVSHESPHFYRARIIKSARTISQEHGDLSQRETFESNPTVIARFCNSQEYKTRLSRLTIIIVVELHDRITRCIGRVFIYDLMKLFIVPRIMLSCTDTVSKPFLRQWFVNVNR